MNEEQPEYEPKISGVEAIIAILVCATFDVLDFFATFLDAFFGAGEFIKEFTNLAISSILFLYAMMKGTGDLVTLAGAALEAVPLLNTLPIRTVTMIIVIWLDRHPKEAEAAETVTRIVKPKLKPGAQQAPTTQKALPKPVAPKTLPATRTP